MATLDPAIRSLYQAHLTPVGLPTPKGQRSVGDLDTFAQLRRLDVGQDSVGPVVKQLDQYNVTKSQVSIAAAALGALATEPRSPAALNLISLVSELDADTVTAIHRAYLTVLRSLVQPNGAPTKPGGKTSEERLAEIEAAAPTDANTPAGPGGSSWAAGLIPIIVMLTTTWQARLTAHPVGRLSLQRMDFLPTGLQRGPLLYSLGLAPGEKTTVTHREWATTESEFADLVSDQLTDFSERGVVDHTELSTSTTTQQQHSLGLSASMTASGGFGPVSVSASAAVTLQDAASRSSTETRKQSQDVTSKAAKRSVRSHQVSFRTGRASGASDETERQVANPFPDRALRVDYYQILRRWRVNLYEYDLRLTYDVVVPEPGKEFLTKYQDIAKLQASLNEPFAFDYSAESLTRQEYAVIAARHGAAVDPPPPETVSVWNSETLSWANRDASNTAEFHTLLVDVPADYEVGQVAVNGDAAPWSPGDPHTFWFPPTDALNGDSLASGWRGKSGTMRLIYRTWHLNSCFVQAEILAKLRPEAFVAWQTTAFRQIRDAALTQFYANQQAIRDQIDELRQSLGDQDALSLRQAEREDLMRGAMQWILGPDFSFALPPGVQLPSGPATIDDFTFATLQARGEMIKFLHHAVEWENASYFLYPYFWAQSESWSTRRNITHPDAVHKAFLRSGAARLVLPVRRGFEKEFVSFVSSGRLDGSSPYLTIAQEIQNEANVQYPGVPGPDPDASTAQATGNLIASWWQHTPTTAMDLSVGETLPDV